MTSTSAPVREQIGLVQTTSLVTGNLVGSGIFLLPAILAGFGAVSLLGWALTAIGAILLALIFAKLSYKIKENGGPHNFVMQAFGRKAGFFSAWGYWILSWISNAALIVAAVSYIVPLTGELSAWQTLAIELLILATIAGINLIGIQFAGKFEVLLTILKLLPLVVIPLWGLPHLKLASFSPLVAEGMSLGLALKSTLFLTVWGFIGLETGTVPAKDVYKPQTTIPIATVLGTTIAAVVYLLGTLVILGLIERSQLIVSKAPYADLAGLLFGGVWTSTIALAAVICCLGSFNGWTLVVGRIANGAAHEGLFPKLFLQEDAKGTPQLSILISSLCTLPLLLLSLQDNLLDQFNAIIDVSITLILLIYLACIGAYFKLFAQEKKLTLTNILIGVGAMAFSLIALWGAGLKMILLSLIFMLLGLPIYYWVKHI
jgi:APA family basic amino acid/polyamine antiporter